MRRYFLRSASVSFAIVPIVQTHIRSRTLAPGIAGLLGLALLISPWSPSTQTRGSFSLALDLDDSEGDQAVSSLDVSPGQVVPIQIFGSDIQNANGISARFGYDTTQVVYEGFDAGDVLPDAQALVERDSTSVRIDVTSPGGSATVNAGWVGTARFRTTDAFSETEIRLVRAQLARGERSDVSTPALGVALQLASAPSPDFDGNGRVDFADFVLFAGAFGYREGDEKYEARYDLNGDGGIAFDDFVIFANSFGNTVNRAPVFTSTVTRSVVENSPAGEPIGSPITAADADGNALSYRLRGADADSFTIDAGTGQLRTREGIAYDHEAKNRYSVTVRVSDGEGGRTSVAVGIAVTDIAEPPAVLPSGVVVTPGDSALTVRWDAAHDEAGKPPVSGYEVTHRQGDRGQWREGLILSSRADTSITLTGLTNEQVYQVRVRTLNDEGASDWSAPVSGAPTAGSVTVPASNEPSLAVPWLYWTDARTGRIQRAELDGSDIRTLVSGLGQPRDLALDRDGGRMYWTDYGSDKIRRANLDGSRVEDLVTGGLKEPFGIALDVAGGKMYWTDWGSDKIQRANLDGSGVEDLVTAGLNEPYGLALDVAGGKMYWTDWGSDRVQRADLDGSGVEDLVTGLNQPRGIALDLGDGRMYWADWGTDKIQRANLNGSQVEDLVTSAGLLTPQAIALDAGGGKMYWTDYGTDKIQRANLDGSGVEDLVTSGLNEPYGLALGAGLPAQIFKAGGDSATLNLAGRFRDPDGGAVTLSVSSSDEAVATAALADSQVTIAPVAPGQITVAVTARDEGGRAATLLVPVTVYPPNRPPVVVQAPADRKVRIDSLARVELSEAFTDPDVGDVLTYTATSSNEAVATAAVEGSGVNIAPKSPGQARVSVTARDPEGLEASLSFGVTVEPKPPPPPPPPPPPRPPPRPRPPPPRPPPPRPPPAPNQAPVFNEGASTNRSVAENTPPDRNIGNPVGATDPEGRSVSYRLASGDDAGSFAVVSSSGQLRARAGATYDYEVKNRYSVTVEADDRNGGTATIGVTIHVDDVEEPPGRPSVPRVEAASSTSLTVTWTEPVNTGPEVDDYDVQYRTGSGSFLPWTHDGDGTTATITGLDVNTRYEVQVRAHNDEGESEWSASGFGGSCSEGGDAPTPVAVQVTAVPIVVASTPDDYFVLYVRHDVDGTTVEVPVLVKRGEAGTTTLAENVKALPAERYRVEKYPITDPADVDGDCIDDLTELNDLGNMSPVNPAPALDISDGAVAVPDQETFETLARDAKQILEPNFAGFEAIKFVLFDRETAIYFMNTKNYLVHHLFLDAVDLDRYRTITGQIVYDPERVAPDGSLGVYYYSTNQPFAYHFSVAIRIHTVLAASLTLLEDNLAWYVSNRVLPYVQSALPSFQASRIPLLFDADVFGDTDFLALNPAVGYGRLRLTEPDERPHPRDIVIYEALPNELPRVAGIISTVPQTPLSHVNLRAKQDGIPNAFIRNALDNDDIDALLGSYVHYTVTEDGWDLRAATPAEVEDHYESSRPAHEQIPQRDLEVTEIKPLSEIGFDDWDAFGVKAANVAVLGTLGFPEGTVPDGFAIPFYFYDTFMKHNGFYTRIETMLADEDFQTDFEAQADSLKKLRKAIEDAETPDWIVSAIETMNESFSEGINRRYRSSTNNEDLPGFNGAGLYDSKSQKPSEDEKDLAKSLKEVYAGLWNFRAFVERDFHRIDHLAAAMGVLVHPSYRDELANGVAVSFDPIYGRDRRYYVNTQVGEDLVTNPEAHSVPEEVLLNPPSVSLPYTVLGTSNQVPPGQLLMSRDQMRQLRERLEVIHEEFEELYDPAAGEPFAMEIEFKITSDDVLAIKQARPWVFGAQVDP